MKRPVTPARDRGCPAACRHRAGVDDLSPLNPPAPLQPVDLTFGSSGIRGPYADVATPEAALGIGRAASELGDEAVVGRDARTTGPLVADALMAGLAGAGVEVRDAGLVTTPTLAHGARTADLGIEVTASHNPPADNGFKLFTPAGASIGPKLQEQVEAAIADPPPWAMWDAVGSIQADPSLVRGHAEAILDAVPPAEVDVVLDGGNGPGGPFTAELLGEQGCRVTSLNASPDGTFPGRPSEPVADNLGDLAAQVRRSEAVLGLAHDGDGDRLAATDETGRVLSGDELLLLFVSELAPDRIVVPVNTTMALADVAPQAEIVRTRVGDAFVSAEIEARGGDFGGEPSGSWILPDVSLCPDGPHAALVLSAIAEDHGGLAEVVPETYPMQRTSYGCPDGSKADAIEAFAAEVGDLGEIDRVDGARVDLDDGWVLLRASGTEPKVRLTVEARDEDTLKSLHERFDPLVRRCLP